MFDKINRFLGGVKDYFFVMALWGFNIDTLCIKCQSPYKQLKVQHDKDQCNTIILTFEIFFFFTGQRRYRIPDRPMKENSDRTVQKNHRLNQNRDRTIPCFPLALRGLSVVQPPPPLVWTETRLQLAILFHLLIKFHLAVSAGKVNLQTDP